MKLTMINNLTNQSLMSLASVLETKRPFEAVQKHLGTWGWVGEKKVFFQNNLERELFLKSNSVKIGVVLSGKFLARYDRISEVEEMQAIVDRMVELGYFLEIEIEFRQNPKPASLSNEGYFGYNKFTDE